MSVLSAHQNPINLVLRYVFVSLVCILSFTYGQIFSTQLLWPTIDEILNQCMVFYENDNTTLAIGCFVTIGRIVSGESDPASQQVL